MTRDEMVSILENRFDRISNITTIVQNEIKLVQTSLESAPFLPWFLISRRATESTTAGEPRVAVPSDFIRDINDAGLWVQNSDGDWKPLKKLLYDELVATYVNSDNARPKHYALKGDYYYLGPTPNDAYTLRMVYYKQDTVLDTNVENDWGKYAPEVLIGRAGAAIASMKQQDYQLAAMFKASAEEVYQGLINADTAREVAGEDNIPGDVIVPYDELEDA